MRNAWQRPHEPLSTLFNNNFNQETLAGLLMIE